MNRQQRRAEERAAQKLRNRVSAFRSTNPMAEATYQNGYTDGVRSACDYAMKTCYAAACLALHDLEGYGRVRNTRFLRLLDDYVVNSMTSDEILDDALEKCGVRINFKEAFSDDRITEVEG